jgi:Cu-processing system ATP-binding protein
MSDEAAMIRVTQATQRFDRFTAVDRVTLDIRRGEVFGLIGHNGAGKSTLFKMMLGLLKPTGGHIEIDGQPVFGAAAREVRRHIGYLPENVALWDNLSGLETLRFFARLKRIDPATCAPLLARVGLGDVGKRPVRAYSKGMRQRLGFAQALLGQPRVLFLDEPTTGLDPRAIHFFWDTLAELRAQGLTIVLTSHVLAELQHRVDRVAVMTNGRLQALGSLPELRAAFDLPLSVRVQRAQGVEVLRVPRSGKRELLLELLRSPEVIDVQVDEPSLEDMFFGSASELPPPLGDGRGGDRGASSIGHAAAPIPTFPQRGKEQDSGAP